jgi:hypothetical protein
MSKRTLRATSLLAALRLGLDCHPPVDASGSLLGKAEVDLKNVGP